MKKVIYLSLALILGFTLSACDLTGDVEPEEILCETGQHLDGTECVDDVVVVLDETSPVLSGLEDVSLEVGDTFDNMSGVMATDDTDGDITTDVEVTGTVDLTTAGVYTLTYKVSDAASNETMGTRTVTVTAPVVVNTAEWKVYGWTVVADDDSELMSYEAIGGSWWGTNAQYEIELFDGAKDAVIFTFTGTEGHSYLFKLETGDGAFTELATVGTGELQELVVPLSSLEEAVRNQISLIVLFCTTEGATGTIDVVGWEYAMLSELPDTTGPVVSGAETVVVALNGTFDAATGVMATDDTDGDLTSAIVVAGTVDVAVAGEYTVTYTVSDAAGNETVVERLVRVVATDYVGYGWDVEVSGDNELLTYEVVGAWWDTNAQQTINSFDGTKDGMLFTFTGTMGHSYLFKVEGDANFELAVVGTGAEQTFVLPLNTLTEAQRNSLGLLIVFCQNVGATGTIELAPFEAVMLADQGDYMYPTITGAGNAMLQVGDTFDATTGVMANDATDGDLTANVVISGDTVDTSVAGEYTVYYTVTDAAGNTAVVSRMVQVTATSWIDFGITVAVNGDNETLTYEVVGNWWDRNAQQVITDFDGTKESMVFTFTGVLDHTYLFKVETPDGAFTELAVVGTGAEQVFELPLGTLTEEQRNALSLLIIFCQTDGATGTLDMAPWEYPADVVLTDWNVYGSFALNDFDGYSELTYGPITANWWEGNAQYPFMDFDETKGSVIWTFTGVENQTYLFKIEGGGAARQLDVTATGVEQSVELDLTTLTEAERAGLNLVVFFATTDGASGTVMVGDFTYGADAPVTPAYIGFGAHTAVVGTGDVAITYTAITDPWWDNNTQFPIENFDATKGSVLVTFTGVLDHSYLFKFELSTGGFKEMAVVGTGAEQTIEIDLTNFSAADRAMMNKLVIFVQTIGAEGTVTVNDFVYGADAPAEAPVWMQYGTHVVTTNPTNTVINYAGAFAWDNNSQLALNDFDGTKEAIEITFSGVTGHEFKFKIEGGGSATEVDVVATGGSQTVSIDLSSMTEAQRAGLDKLVFFVLTSEAAGAIIIDGWDYPSA